MQEDGHVGEEDEEVEGLDCSISRTLSAAAAAHGVRQQQQQQRTPQGAAPADLSPATADAAEEWDAQHVWPGSPVPPSPGRQAGEDACSSGSSSSSEEGGEGVEELDLQGFEQEALWWRRWAFWGRALSWTISLAFFTAGLVLLAVDPQAVSVM